MATSNFCYNTLKRLGILPLSATILPVDPLDSQKCDKYIRSLLPISIQFRAMRICCQQYYGYIPEEIFIQIEEMIGEMEQNEEKNYLNHLYEYLIHSQLKRIYWLPYILGWIQMLVIISYSICFLFFLSPFHVLHPMQKLFSFIYLLSWILLITVTLQIIGISFQILSLDTNKMYRVRFLFELSMIDDYNDFYIPVMKWCNSLKCDNCINLKYIYWILLEKYGLLYFISIVLILSNNYHHEINTAFLQILSFLQMQNLYYRMYTESDKEDDDFFFMYIVFWVFHLFLLPFGSLFNAFPKRKMLSLTFRYLIVIIFGLLIFLFICYVWYYQLIQPLIYANISWLFCMGSVSLFCAGKCIRKYIYYGYYSEHDGDGKEYLKLSLQHLGCVYIMDGLFLSMSGFYDNNNTNNKLIRYSIYCLLHLLSILSAYLYYLQIQIRLQYKQNGDCFNVDANTYLCAWFLTYHQDIDWINNSNAQCNTESFIDTESSIITLNNITHNAVL